jgi:hypothetical protein
MDTEATYFNFFYDRLQQNGNLISVAVLDFMGCLKRHLVLNTLPLRHHHKFESNEDKRIHLLITLTLR